MSETKKGLFFDLDGTLWDAIKQIHQSWNETMERLNQSYRFTLPQIKSTMGLTPIETLPITFPDSNEDEGMDLFIQCIKDEIKFLSINPGTLYPNEEKVLSLLSEKYPLYVISNSDKGYIENYLSSCHMEKYFKDHLCAGDTKKAKWENILIMKEKEKLDDVIYIGDTNKDKIESSKANVNFIHAAYGFGIIENNKYNIQSLDELPSMVEIVFNKKL